MGDKKIKKTDLKDFNINKCNKNGQRVILSCKMEKELHIQQGRLSNSAFLYRMRRRTLEVSSTESGETRWPWDWSWLALACRKACKSPWSHRNIASDSFDMNVLYKGWDTEVAHDAKRCMKCHMSSLTIRSSHCGKRYLVHMWDLPQQSWST